MRKATLASILRKSRHGLRLNEHMEHPEGDVVFRHACKMGLEGIVSEIALQVWAVAGLAQVQEPRGAGGPARGGRGLGAAMTTLTMRMIKGHFVSPASRAERSLLPGTPRN